MVQPMPDNQVTQLDPSGWVDRYGDYLYRYAISRLRDPEAAEEVLQETFVAALRALDQYAGRGAEQAWLLGILKRKIIDHVRKRNRLVTADDDAPEAWLDSLFDRTGHWRADPRLFQEADPDAAMQREDFWEAFHHCLDSLPQKQADAFTLRELDEKPAEEICKDLGISSSNLWVLLHRARLRLSSCLKASWLATGEA